MARSRCFGSRSRDDRAARRRQVRRQQLQGVRRPARRGCQRGQRAVAEVAGGCVPERLPLPAGIQQRCGRDPTGQAGNHHQTWHHRALLAVDRGIPRQRGIPLRHPGPPPARTVVPQFRRHARPCR
ncbi:hypothetical protein G6F63_015458 [Rhizopus arrhizus]|nr:hypothetical protein G6F63_015458 [Rhizopus arrhizus]